MALVEEGPVRVLPPPPAKVSRPGVPPAVTWPLISIAVVGACAALCAATGIPFADLSRDASEVFRFPFYFGAVSQLGILAWGASAAICLFAAFLPVSGEESAERRRFLLGSAALTGWLVLDDLLTLHEVVLPALGLRHRYVLLMYVLGIAAWLLRFRRLIFRTDYSLLVAALCAFGFSVIADGIQSRMPLKGHHYVEDGAKLSGIILWTTYFAKTSLLQARGRRGTYAPIE